MTSIAYDYGFIALYLILALAMVTLPLALARWLAPHQPGPLKQAPYECGVPARQDPWLQMRIQYYLYALLFVVFEVEVIFVYGWAVEFRTLGWLGTVEMMLFLGVLALGLAYAWRKDALRWE